MSFQKTQFKRWQRKTSFQTEINRRRRRRRSWVARESVLRVNVVAQLPRKDNQILSPPVNYPKFPSSICFKVKGLQYSGTYFYYGPMLSRNYFVVGRIRSLVFRNQVPREPDPFSFHLFIRLSSCEMAGNGHFLVSEIHEQFAVLCVSGFAVATTMSSSVEKAMIARPGGGRSSCLPGEGGRQRLCLCVNCIATVETEALMKNGLYLCRIELSAIRGTCKP